MANTTIYNLPALNTVDSTSLFPLSSNVTATPTTYQASIGNIGNAITGNLRLSGDTLSSTNEIVTIYGNVTDQATALTLTNSGDAALWANANVTINSNSQGSNPQWIFDTTGNLVLPNGAVIKDTVAAAVAFGDGAGANTQGAYSVAVGSGAGANTQGTDAVAVGTDAGANTQGNLAVAIGYSAGFDTQGLQAVAIGYSAGQYTQGNNSVAIGYSAGVDTQGEASIAIGQNAGNTTQGNSAVAIGVYAGQTGQGNEAVAIGDSAGQTDQHEDAVAIGQNAGQTGQGISSVAIGYGAGFTDQGNQSVAIGENAGANQGSTAIAIGQNAGGGVAYQNDDAVAIGHSAGEEDQGTQAIAIGLYTGQIAQGLNSIALGAYAGQTNQANNSIILNATGSALEQTVANTFTVKPVRQGNTANAMYYDASTGEITYDVAGGGNANTGNVTFDNINIIGTGNLNLQPDPANTGSYLDIFLTSGPDLHLVASASANLILGKDLGANVMTSWDGNAYVQSWNLDTGNVGGIWTFNGDGSLQVPTNNADPIPGTIASANGYPTLLAYGSGGGFGIHGGPELDWMNADDPANNFGNVNVLRNTMYLNGGGLYIGMNENGVVGNTIASWSFNPNGSTIFPTLTVQRGDNPSGTITGQTLLFGDNTQEAIISTPDGNSTSVNSQRLVINPGQGFDGGEGGDIYLWAGRGGDGSGSGGDIKIRGGQGGANTTGGSGGDGGYIRIEAGDSATTGGAPGYIDINGGINYLGVGGYVDIRGGQGHTIGGDANITGGYGYDDRGGNVNIWGGGSANGQINEGNVNIQTGGNTWTFDPSGNLTLPNGTKFGTPEGSGTTGIVAPIETAFLIETNSLPTDPPTTMVISGADFVAVNLTYTRDFGQPTPTWYPAGYTPGVDPYIEFSAIHNNQYEINVPGFPQALYVNGGTLNIPLAQWAINPPFGSEAPTGVYTYPSNYIYSWSFGVDRALYFPEGSSLGGSLASNEFALFNNVNTNFAIYTNDGNSHQWNFGADGVISVDGNLKLAPDSNNAGSYLDIFLSSGPDLHLVASANANLILGKDNQSNVMTSWDGNVYVQSWSSNTGNLGGIWTFDGDGNLTLPANSTIKNNAEISYGGGVTIQVSDLANAVVQSPGSIVGNTYNNTGFTKIIFTDSTLYNALVTAGIAPETIVATTWSNGSTTQLNTYVYVQFPGSPDTFSLRPCDANGNTIVGDWVFPSVVGTTIPANVAITSVGTSTFHTWNFISDGNLTVPGAIVGAGYSRLDMVTDGPNTAYLGTTNNDTTALYLQEDTVQMYANTDVYITANVGGTGQGWTFGTDGNLTLPNDATISDFGDTASLNVEGAGKYAQLYWNGNIGNGNPDIGGDYYTWAYIGNVGFTIQHKNDSTSTDNEWRFDIDGNITLPTGTPSINYANGSPYGGGGANTGNVTFDDQVVIGTGDGTTGSGGLYLAPGLDSTANLQYLRVSGGDVASHIHLDTGNNEYFDLYIGTDSRSVKIANTGNIDINTNDGSGNSASWTFAADGNLIFPTGNLVITPDDPAGNIASIVSTDHPLAILSTGANGAVATVWVEDYANVGTSNIAAVYANPTSGSKIVRIAVGQNGSPGPNLWDFNANGTLTTPGNINLGNAALQSFGANYVLTANSQNYDTAVSMTDGGGVNLISANVGVQVTSGTDVWVFNTDGSLTFPDSTLQTTAYTGAAASVPSQNILPTIQSITISATSSGGTGGGSGWANVTVANTIPVTEYGVIVTAGTISQKYVTGSLGSIPGTVQLNITTGLNTTPFTVYAYVTSNAGTYYSNSATGTSGICLLAGTQIALSDGSYKAIEDINYTDKMLSWDFDRGCYAETTALWIKYSETGSQYNLLTFSDGTTLRTFDQHRIFNKQAGAFTYPMTDATPIGTITVNEHGQEITLTSKQVIQNTIEYYNVITDYHMNLFSDSVLTSCRFNNIYPITDMKFVKDARMLRTRDEFENVPDRFFNGLRLAEQTTDIETVEWYVNRLLSSEVLTQSELTV